MEALRASILACRDCAPLFGFAPNPVVTGTQSARIMQISQAPSRSAHAQGRPFCDASGQTLRQSWYVIDDETFYDPANFYITAIAHCFPGKAKGGGDRPPPRHCADKWLAQEMDAVDNALYILIGGHAARYFFPREAITQLVFEDRQIRGKPAFILPHPSPLNVRWFREHPAFFSQRLPIIRAAVHTVLGLP